MNMQLFTESKLPFFTHTIRYLHEWIKGIMKLDLQKRTNLSTSRVIDTLPFEDNQLL